MFYFCLMTRETILTEVIEQSYKYKNLLLSAGTGVGKTFMCISFIEEHLNKGKVLFVVPQISLITNTRLEFIKFGKEHYLPHIDFCCYAGLNKYIDNNYELVCLDEIHNGLSDNRLELLSKIKCFKRIALTATITSEQKQQLDDVLGEFKEVKVTLTEAIENSIVSAPKINIEYVELDDEIKRNPFKFKNNTVMLSDRAFYDKMSDSITYWKNKYETEGSEFMKIQMLQQGSKRAVFLSNCKEEKAKELIEYLGTSRFICFTGSVAQAKRLGENVCSSEKSKSNNSKMIKDFNEGKIDNLLAKNMLVEGQNLVDTKYAICIQLGSKERKGLQMLGRSLRHNSPEIFLIIVKDTVDERFLRETFKNNQSLLN